MKIAIIEPDVKLIIQYREKIKSKDWEVMLFTNSIDFGRVDVSRMDVIISNSKLSHISGADVLNAVKDKTKAELYLMNDSTTEFITPGNLNHIKGFLVKKDPDTIIDQLQYIETKLEINTIMRTEELKYADMLKHINGFSFNTQDGIILIDISDTLSNIGKKTLFNKIKESDSNKGIISYPERSYLGNVDCSQIFEINKIFKRKHKKLVFFNINKHHCIENTIKTCKLNNVVPMFNEMDEAISFLNQ